MDFIFSTFKGFIIGMGAILPGISSGVFCVIFGIYDKLVESTIGIFKNFKENFKFLFPIILGAVLGFLLFGNLLKNLFIYYENECKSLFLGFIIGGIPAIIKTANERNSYTFFSKKKCSVTSKNFKFSFLIFTLLSFLLGVFLFMFEKNFDISTLSTQNNFLILFLSGLAMSCGIIVPGVSSTVILMCFGTYYTYLDAISNFNFTVLFPLGSGLLIGCIIFLFLIRYLLNRFPAQTYYSIIGFVLGSTLIIVPNHLNILNILLFLLGLNITFNIEKKHDVL